jgi:hypothetical protein
MTRLESKEHITLLLRGCSDDKAQRKTALVAAALAVSFPSRTTATDIQKEASPFGDVKPDGLVCIHKQFAKQ